MPTSARSTASTRRRQYHVNSLVETDYVALNTAKAPFNSVNVRKAANFAIDRPAMLRVRGKYAGQRTDQILPPGMGGFRTRRSTRSRARTTRRRRPRRRQLQERQPVDRQLDHGPGSSARSSSYNLSQIGCNVDVKLFQGFQIYVAAGPKGGRLRRCFVGWNQDYPDPYDFLDVLLNGNNIHEQQQQPRLLQQRRDQPEAGPAEQARGRCPRTRRTAISTSRSPRSTRRGPSYDNRTRASSRSARIGGYLFQPANASGDLNTMFVK